jgi:ribonuclease VapC
MIVVDSSALIAIFELEADAATCAEAMGRAERLALSAVNAHETGVVMRARHGEPAIARMWRFLLEENDFEIALFDEAQARDALQAYGVYGKGVHPLARLNLADCAAYALAKTRDWPLFFKGRDFAATDVPCRLAAVHPPE